MKQKINIWENHSATVLSITLVLFLLGLCLLVEYHSYRTTHDMQERITYKVDLEPDISDEVAELLKMKIETLPEVKHVDYISREKAAEIFSEELNDDFVSFIGYNPLYPSMMVNLKVDYLPEVRQNGREESIEHFTQKVGRFDYVTGVTYQETVVHELNDVFYKITWFLVIFMALLFIISILMVSSTIRIALYSQRDTIRTMQLVGAKRRFIARPFVARSIWYGLLGAIIAIAVLAIAMGAIDQSLMGRNLLDPTHLIWYGGIAVLIVVIGIALSYLSTLFAVNSHLNKANKSH
ncbi:MAG: permease-like cell division protein FtsX [Bacteroidales bacterium]|nr:permease-like cell division protein FtsX [Candidatus Colimorpha merdihippi]